MKRIILGNIFEKTDSKLKKQLYFNKMIQKF